MARNHGRGSAGKQYDSAHDIFGTAVIVAAQAVDKSYLFPKLKDGPAA